MSYSCDHYSLNSNGGGRAELTATYNCDCSGCDCVNDVPSAPPMPPPPPSPPPAPRRVIRFGYFAEAQTHAVGCARGLFHLEGTTDAAGDSVDLEVVCLPQSSGGYAVAKLDRGDLDVAVLGSTPWAMAVSRGVDLSAFYVPHSKGDSQALVTRDTIATPRDLQGRRSRRRLGARRTSTSSSCARSFRASPSTSSTRRRVGPRWSRCGPRARSTAPLAGAGATRGSSRWGR